MHLCAFPHIFTRLTYVIPIAPHTTSPQESFVILYVLVLIYLEPKIHPFGLFSRYPPSPRVDQAILAYSCSQETVLKTTYFHASRRIFCHFISKIYIRIKSYSFLLFKYLRVPKYIKIYHFPLLHLDGS